LILGSELDLSRGFVSAFHFRADFSVSGIVNIVAVFAFIETDGSFEHQEHVVTGLLDLADGFGDAIGVRQGIVNRVSQFLH
jgi:hypothetical protein